MSAGPDLEVPEGETVFLDGSVSNDLLRLGISTTWAQVSGPGSAFFADSGALDTEVRFSRAGTYVLRLTASAGGLAVSDDVMITVRGRDQAPGMLICVSSTTGGTVGGLTFTDQDLLLYDVDNDAWSMYFDASDVGLSGDINAFHINSDGSILLSLAGPTPVPGLGTVDDSDVVLFVPSSTGGDTSGYFEWYFDGSDVGLSTNAEEVDAIALDTSGRLVISTKGRFHVDGLSGNDEDLIVFTANELGENTSGSWELFFDGRDYGLFNSPGEDVNGSWIDSNADIYLSTKGDFLVAGLEGGASDIFTVKSRGPGRSSGIRLYMCPEHNGTLGDIDFKDEDILTYDVDSDTWSVYFDGSDVGLRDANLDAFHLQSDGSLLLSWSADVELPDVGTADDADILRFIPEAIGVDTRGRFEWYFDGSDVELTKPNEDINAIGFTVDGRLVVSTKGEFEVGGLSGDGKDLIAFTATQLGEDTRGSWELFFDGSDEDLNGVWIDNNGNVYVSTEQSAGVSALVGDSPGRISELFGDRAIDGLCAFVPVSFGSEKVGAFELFWEGAAHGFGSEVLDGFSVFYGVHRRRPYVWISPEEIMSLPMSGPAWDQVLWNANRDAGTPNLSNMNQNNNVYVLAKAYVYIRTGIERYRTEVRENCMAAIDTELGGNALALGRELAAYVIAADLVELSPAENEAFRVWLRRVLKEKIGGKSLRKTHEDRPNNWGALAGASRMAAAVYLGDAEELEAAARVFKGYLGDRSSYQGFKFQTGSQGAQTWSPFDVDNLVPINPVGAVVDGHNVDGAVIDDISRGCPFQWPPCHTGYPWEALAGAVVQAEILHRQGYPAYEWEDRALLRAYEYLLYLHEEFGFWFDEGTVSGDDSWQPWIVNKRYNVDLPTVLPARHGKIMGWSDWTHAE